MHTWSLSSVHVSVTGPWISGTLTHSYNVPPRDLQRSYGSALLMNEWLFSLPCHRSSVGLWFWQMIQIHLVFLTSDRSAPPASAKWCCLLEKNKLFWRDLQKALWLQHGLGENVAVPEKWVSMGKKSTWVNFFLRLLRFCWGPGSFAWRKSTTVPFITCEGHESFIFCAQWKIPLSIGIPLDIMWQMHPSVMPAAAFFFGFWHATS